MADNRFKAMKVFESDDGKFNREIVTKEIDELPQNDVLIKVCYSSLNYKDALSATGHKGITRNFPHTPGIDAAGTVVDSKNNSFRVGDEVIVIGFDLGMNTSGGFAQYIRVPSSWIVKLPENLSLKESMIYGTAGFTAALSIYKLELNGVRPGTGEILVTGATGGVGSMAVAMLSHIGYEVVAVTGKHSEKDFLRKIGAKTIISREEADDTKEKPLLKERWAGVIDTVGGRILSTAIKSTKYGASVTCCGMITSTELKSTIFPFILRGVNLLGIASSDSTLEEKREIWSKISSEWKLNNLDYIHRECALESVIDEIPVILDGKLRGRIVINLLS